MKQMKNIYILLVLILTSIGGAVVTSCTDDMAEENYYTFTGEMMSDYLQKHDDYKLFAEIVKRATASQRGVNLMDLLSVRGQYTCFAPNNNAVKAYLEANGYSSVEDIPVDICDTIARTHIVNGKAYNTVDLSGSSSLPTVNMNDRYLTVQPDTVVNPEDDQDTLYVTYKLNRSGVIIYELANDSVENGIVQPLDAMLSISNQTIADLMRDNAEEAAALGIEAANVSLFSEAMKMTGLSKIMSNKVKDSSWNPDEYEDRSVYSGAQWDYCHIPETKYYKFTVFACPDKVLRDKYGITDIKSFYDYAYSLYGNEDFYDDAALWQGKSWEEVKDNEAAMTAKGNPLRRLIGYNCLDRLGMCNHRNGLVTICTIATEQVNPCEWYSTMDSLATVKVEFLTVSNKNQVYSDNDVRNCFYLNRGDRARGDVSPGIRIFSETEGSFVNEALNGVYYTTDGLADYGKEVRDRVFNTRMRMDMYTLFPELMSNTIRDGRTTNRIGDSNNPDKGVTSPNYWFPNGYLDNVKINEDGIFLFQSQHNTYWSYEGDEFNLASDVNNYDIEFYLPSVPSGTYQIRLGFANMGTRGICQFYLDGEPKNIPFDMRSDNFGSRTGYFELTNSSSYPVDSEEWEAAKKNMHNLGWYHGPRSVFCMSGEGHEDGTNNRGSYFCNIERTCRFVLCTAQLDQKKRHKVRIKSVWAVGTALVMLDYFEIVPKSVYGVEGEGLAEDDY